MNTNEKAIRDLPALRQNLIDLGKSSSKVFNSQIRLPPRSDLKFMMLSYAVKQIEHSNSLLQLDQSVDTVLIARSMLEGLVQLLWATKYPRRRPLMWRAFSLVLDWRVFQERRSKGESFDINAETLTIRRLRRYRNWFLTAKAKKALANGNSLPSDPYVRNWYGERESEIFADVGAENLYRAVYGPFSEWHHWRTGGFGRVMTFDKSTFTFDVSTTDPAMVASALAAGFQCLWQTMYLLNTRFRLGLGRDLRRVRAKQLASGK